MLPYMFVLIDILFEDYSGSLLGASSTPRHLHLTRYCCLIAFSLQNSTMISIWLTTYLQTKYMFRWLWLEGYAPRVLYQPAESGTICWTDCCLFITILLSLLIWLRVHVYLTILTNFRLKRDTFYPFCQFINHLVNQLARHQFLKIACQLEKKSMLGAYSLLKVIESELQSYLSATKGRVVIHFHAVFLCYSVLFAL